MRAYAWIKHQMGGTSSWLQGFVQETGAAAAVEFAVVAPVLLLMTLTASELGGTISNRMALDGAFRSGMQAVNEGRSVSEIAQMMGEASLSRFTHAPAFSVEEYCTCGSATSTVVSCTNICIDGAPRSFLKMSVETSESSLLMPGADLAPSVYMQVR